MNYYLLLNLLRYSHRGQYGFVDMMTRYSSRCNAPNFICELGAAQRISFELQLRRWRRQILRSQCGRVYERRLRANFVRFRVHKIRMHENSANKPKQYRCSVLAPKTHSGDGDDDDDDDATKMKADKRSKSLPSEPLVSQAFARLVNNCKQKIPCLSPTSLIL